MKPCLVVKVLYFISFLSLCNYLFPIISTEHTDSAHALWFSNNTNHSPRLSIKTRLRPAQQFPNIKLTPEQQERVKRAYVWYVQLNSGLSTSQVREVFEKYYDTPKLRPYHIDILTLHHNYWHEGFQKFIATFPEYEQYILDQHKQLEDSMLHNLKLKWHSRADKVIKEMAQQIIGLRAKRKQERMHERQQQERECQERTVQKQFEKDLSKLEHLVPEYQQLHDVYEEYGIGERKRITKRLDTLTSSPHTSLVYTTQSYSIPSNGAKLLKNFGINTKDYKQCYGNQLQQLIHQECIGIIEHASTLPAMSPIYEYRAAIVDCADSARAYNQAGNVYHALNMADLCWALLDYGTAVLEGVAEGVIGALEDMIEHPVHTLACVIAGEYVLAYQLLKVTVNLADIGITYTFDKQAGTDKWHDYTEPLAQLCTAVASKELTLRTAIKTGAKVATSMYAQHKVLKGLDKLYSTAQAKAVQFIADNPLATPQRYMATPEGIVLKSVQEGLTTTIKGGSDASGLTNYLKANCKQQGWNLSETGSFINGRYYTKHALERMAPFTKEVLEELEKRALKKGFLRGSNEFNAYVNPRGIPPMVVEDAIKVGNRLPGKHFETFDYFTNEIKVITNKAGDVVSVHRISS